MGKRMKPQDIFSHSLDRIADTARSWGYRSKREQSTFSNGYMKGFADGLMGKPPGGEPKPRKKAPKGVQDGK
jgi:hypothetical protein